MGMIAHFSENYFFVQALPWLQWSSLQSAEEERKERVRRLEMERAAAEGKGFGPPPKLATGGQAPKVSSVHYYYSMVATEPPTSSSKW